MEIEVIQPNNTETERYSVEFDFENAPAHALEQIPHLAEDGGAMKPAVLGELCKHVVVKWSFKGDPKDVESYRNITMGEYKFLLKEFTKQFKFFFGDSE